MRVRRFDVLRASSVSICATCKGRRRTAASPKKTSKISSRKRWRRRGRRRRCGALPFALPAWPKIDFAQFGPIERQPLSRIKKISGPVLHRNWVSIPHVTNNDEADITDLEAFRKQVNAEDPNAKLTILAFVMKALVSALKRYPDFNSSLDGDALILKKYYNIGFAADTPAGLIVPVLKDADKKGVTQIAAETRELARADATASSSSPTWRAARSRFRASVESAERISRRS